MEAGGTTRMALLDFRRREAIARKGRDLLEGKRQALVGELLEAAKSAATARDTLRQAVQRARDRLTIAQAVLGQEAIAAAGFAARRDLGIELIERNVWGLRYPDVRHEAAARAPGGRGAPLAGTPPLLDEAAAAWEDTLDGVLQAVSVQWRLRRLAEEIRRTTRRIHALEDRLLPDLARRIRAVRARLEESEREDRFRLQRFKARRASGEA